MNNTDPLLVFVCGLGVAVLCYFTAYYTVMYLAGVL